MSVLQGQMSNYATDVFGGCCLPATCCPLPEHKLLASLSCVWLCCCAAAAAAEWRILWLGLQPLPLALPACACSPSAARCLPISNGCMHMHATHSCIARPAAHGQARGSDETNYWSCMKPALQQGRRCLYNLLQTLTDPPPTNASLHARHGLHACIA